MHSFNYTHNLSSRSWSKFFPSYFMIYLLLTGRGRGGPRGRGDRGRGRGGRGGGRDQSAGGGGCFKCGEEGHFSRECPNQSAGGGKGM